jgi:hypothetical protein
MMVIVAVYIVAVLIFCAGFYFAHFVRTFQQVARTARTAFSTMTDPTLDDLAKEKTIQACAILMVKQVTALFIKLGIILLATVFPVWLTSALDLITIEAISSFVLRVDVMLITTAIMLVAIVAYKQINKT